ncbi:hypothetical protein [uncultured Sphaerochaeta sp.]|uniref:hypothetical protein n=1 Tax=uncultured Sphaerochaeta sp. TaxID=886478 RepID=UPI0029CA442E|nr:hypothetical protein [uncultured Sphaerochaeta sp.]
MADEQKDAGKVSFIGMDPAVLRTDSFRFFFCSRQNSVGLISTVGFSACFHDLEEEVLNISKSAERT